MKRLLFSLAAAAAASLLGVETVQLRPGANLSPKGEALALEAFTADAAPTVKVVRVASVQTFTNAVSLFVEEKVRYDFALTNWNGQALVETNCYDRFDYSDWTLLGTNHVRGVVSVTNEVVTNLFSTLLPGPKAEVTNDLFEATASGHYLMATNPALPVLSGFGRLVVTGASADDRLVLFVK